MRSKLVTLAVLLVTATSAQARELATVTRIDADTVELTREDTKPVAVWLSDDTVADDADTLVARDWTERSVQLDMPADRRGYVLLEADGGEPVVAAERSLPLAQASNFRDIGGYVTKDGRTVKWGRGFRSGAMPMLTEADYALIGQLGIDSVVDFRSLEEREVVPDRIDDKTGALFVSNDYSLKPLFARFGKGDGENTYAGMEKLLAPQYRSFFKRLIADEGAVLYHCSAGQDRTGIATAILYDVLGVDRETILKDYHLSTALRRPQWEMPKLDPEDYPDNPIVQYYFSLGENARKTAEPLYTPSGASHLAQFFAHIDKTYGGSEGYLKQGLGFTGADLARLREVMLD
ncbi:protein tyrosine phosphatase [Novosphingobium sp. PC22D]|uniref:tyrosine-protein phosphatase n=1 Tax=Novosphingobium sp. PC22D TaxID=1962403 RepID=UPI000BF09354|nr:tyrosine-protein phosphatase [Novosphingobium sp. PC22D]PEQ14014.1 protein tyrosine phosphatase [Novosphingobium sp. PC22D]